MFDIVKGMIAPDKLRGASGEAIDSGKCGFQFVDGHGGGSPEFGQ